MIRLEDLQPNAAVRGLLPDSLVTVVSVEWFGSGKPGNKMGPGKGDARTQRRQEKDE